jgi:hypothetical protein
LNDLPDVEYQGKTYTAPYGKFERAQCPVSWCVGSRRCLARTATCAEKQGMDARGAVVDMNARTGIQAEESRSSSLASIA